MLNYFLLTIFLCKIYITFLKAVHNDINDYGWYDSLEAAMNKARTFYSEAGYENVAQSNFILCL